MPKPIRVSATRADITNPDRAEATLVFDTAWPESVEMTVRWGDPERDRGTYLISKMEAWDLYEFLKQHLDDE